MNPTLAFSRPDYLVPTLGVVIAFGVMWLADRSQRHHLWWTIAFALSVIAAATQPSGGIPGYLSPGFVAWLVSMTLLTTVFLLAGSAAYAGWSRRATLALVCSCLAPALVFATGVTSDKLALVLDAILLIAFLGTASALWSSPGPGRAAAVLLALRGFNFIVLTALLPGYTLQTRAGINQLLGCGAALLLLVAGFRGILQQQLAHRTALERQVEQRSRELIARREELAARLDSLERFAEATTRAVSLPLGRMRALCRELAAQVDATGRGHLARCEAAIARMSGLLQSLRTLSRIATHVLQREPLDVSAMAEQAWSHIGERRAGERAPGIAIEPGLHACADRELLAIVLDNLLDNAWKYGARNPAARVRFMRDAEGGFVVADNGAGFDPAQAARLFEPFQRLHDARDYEGTGVGLATVRRIVERHGGTIEASAQPAEGARFRFTLAPG